jgi:Response regulator receiver domain
VRGRAVLQASGDRSPGHGLFRVTILLVEDEVLVRMSLAHQLRSAGYVVLEASNADQALDLLQGHRVQVVLSDIQMPGRLDGVNSLTQSEWGVPRSRSCWHPRSLSLPVIGATMMASFLSPMMPGA